MKRILTQEQTQDFSNLPTSLKMTFQTRFFVLIAIIASLKAEWVEITQKPSNPVTNKPKSSIRILKKSEVEHLFNIEKTTPSPQWIAYQKERFGQQHNSGTHGLVVTAENQMKNSVKIMVSANNGTSKNETAPKNRIIKTKTRVDVVNDKPIEELVEIPQTKPQTTTRRDMNHAGSNDYEYVENVDEIEQDEQDQNSEQTEDDSESFIDTDESGVALPSWKGFLKYMKRVQQYWVKHAGLTINQKINYLKRLRDRLMVKIEEQFDMIWPSRGHPRRNGRSLLGESSINFPPEIPLMTINFLTFGVFLIKITLLIIKLLKSKHYKLTGLNIATQAFTKT